MKWCVLIAFVCVWGLFTLFSLSYLTQDPDPECRADVSDLHLYYQMYYLTNISVQQIICGDQITVQFKKTGEHPGMTVQEYERRTTHSVLRVDAGWALLTRTSTTRQVSENLRPMRKVVNMETPHLPVKKEPGQQIISQDNILWSRNWRSATCMNIPNKYMATYGTEHHATDLSFARKCYTVWLRLGSGHPSDIETFIQNELPTMQEFRLVTTDGDHSVPTEIEGYETLLNSDKLIGWYTQNYDGYEHPKMHPVPIGFDLHTTGADVKDMVALRDSSSERVLGIIQPPWSYDHPDRSIRHSCVKKFPKMKRNELWSLYTQYTHGLSPHGNGLDCHRTWEMLFFGMIPIVKTSSLDSMYDGLPVVILQDWDDLCKYPLQRLKAVDERVMTTEYWLS